MSDNSDNRIKAFAEVVSIDAWHDDLNRKAVSVKLFADVFFDTARLGGERESAVRFKLSVRRAELIAIIPETEPFSIDRRSINRFIDRTPAKRRTKQTKTTKRATEASGSLTASLANLAVKAKLASEFKTKTVTEEAITKFEASTPMKITFKYNNLNSTYHWRFEAKDGDVLSGRPWDDPNKTPLLKLVDKRGDRIKSLPPTVRLELRCMREDLEISDIQIKDANVWQDVLGRMGHDKRMLAAEAYIKIKLEEVGLYSNDISEAFSLITLASVNANDGPVD